MKKDSMKYITEENRDTKFLLWKTALLAEITKGSQAFGFVEIGNFLRSLCTNNQD